VALGLGVTGAVVAGGYGLYRFWFGSVDATRPEGDAADWEKRRQTQSILVPRDGVPSDFEKDSEEEALKEQSDSGGIVL